MSYISLGVLLCCRTRQWTAWLRCDAGQHCVVVLRRVGPRMLLYQQRLAASNNVLLHPRLRWHNSCWRADSWPRMFDIQWLYSGPTDVKLRKRTKRCKQRGQPDHSIVSVSEQKLLVFRLIGAHVTYCVVGLHTLVDYTGSYAHTCCHRSSACCCSKARPGVNATRATVPVLFWITLEAFRGIPERGVFSAGADRRRHQRVCPLLCGGGQRSASASSQPHSRYRCIVPRTERLAMC
jgi:hypothetical protein